MLRVMLIDDEPPALRNMELMLSDFENVHIAGMYTRGEKALAAIEKDKPDAVFADIEMPGKNGLDIASEIADKYNDIDVVFVTAYNQYAISAFEASAVDYLLKPVRKERLKNTVARLERRRSKGNNSDNEDRKIRIQCFGKFTIYNSWGSLPGRDCQLLRRNHEQLCNGECEGRSIFQCRWFGRSCFLQ